MAANSSGKKGWFQKLFPVFVLVIFAAALWALHREISHFNFADFRTYIRGLSKWELSLAVIATVAGYFALVCYDWFAFQYIKQKLAFQRIALTSFIGYAFSMNIGQSVLSGGAVRMRMYSAWGIDAGDVTRVIGFNFVVGIVGQLLAGGLLFTFSDFSFPETVSIPIHSVKWLGVLFLIIVAGFFWLLGKKREAIQIRNWKIELPPLRIAIPAITVALCDWLLAGVVLYLLMPPDMEIGMWHFLGTVLLAQIAGLLSMVPGGLGVFESVIISLLPGSVSSTAALSALIAYRAIYYLLPFVLAILLLGGHETFTKRDKLSSASDKLGQWIAPLLPSLLAAMVFVSGVVLLLSGATPAVASRLVSLEKIVPLPIVELSHFLGSIVGVVLLLLSSAIQRRIDAAWWATSLVLVAGILASLFKGIDYEEACILGGVLIVLLLCRKRFTRHASLFALRFTKGWWLSVGMVVATVTWIGFAAYERVHYHEELWARFGFKADASRFLRASAGIAAALGGFAIWQLLRPGLRIVPIEELPDETGQALPLIKSSPDTNAYLGLLGDKRFLFSKSGKSFIMYGIQNRTMIALGDVIGDPGEEEDLAWEFRELCNESGHRAAFYQVSADRAHLYAGLGLLLYKLGEEARVSLPDFSLEGSARKDLRYTKKKIEREGAVFEMVPSSRFEEIKGELKAISDEWLSEKKAAEKGFSLGCYREDYLRHFEFAVIRVNGKIVAFSNICIGAEQHELSIDLMRHSNDAPYGAMEYLFIHLMLWGKEQGFEWFSLGMAPLSGLENRSLAPVWNRIGAQIFKLGEHFYNFKGLRSYKEKFDPVWEPRYLACRSMVQLPVVLLDTAALIGRSANASNLEKSDSKKEVHQ